MCIDDNLALHAKSKDGYIKHLEDYLLQHGYNRCQQCKRVECDEEMTGILIGPDVAYVCDACLPAWDRDEQELKEIADSDERDYRQAKGY